MKNYISQIINSKIDFLKSSYKTNRLVQHQGVKGGLNQILLVELIHDVIPNKYKFTNGIIQDSEGFQSNESDIIIYDNEILPAVLFGGGLGFVPAESVGYVFEVKSTLNATEIKTTVEKFSNLCGCYGFQGRRVLFAFSSDLKSKSELERYYENDQENFLNHPLIGVLMVDGRGYYFFNSKKIYIKDLIDKNEFAKKLNEDKAGSLKVGGFSININPEANINIEGDLIVNGLNYEDLYVHVYRWYGSETHSPANHCFLLFLSGISNTLSKQLFGKYLMADHDENMKIYSECVIDMWGNASYKNVNFDGYDETNLKDLNFSISLNEDARYNKIEIYPK